MYEFTYHPASSAADALAHLGEGKFLAGGQTLIATMKHRLAQPGHLVDLGKIADLRGVEDKGDRVSVKAMTTHAQVAESKLVADSVPGLDLLASEIGDPAVRHRGTIGGSLANNDPAADYPAAVLALNADIVTDRRTIPAQEFFTGLFSTALEENELIVAVEFPKTKLYYGKFAHPASRFALVGVAIAKDAQTKAVRVAVTGCGDEGVFRWKEAEQALSKKFDAAALENLTPDAAKLSGDLHGSPEYRAHLVAVMARRALATKS